MREKPQAVLSGVAAPQSDANLFGNPKVKSFGKLDVPERHPPEFPDVR